MDLHGLADALTSISSRLPPCPRCGTVARVAPGLCVSCSLQSVLQGEGSSHEEFSAVLAEVELRDTDWRLGNYQILEEIGRGGMGIIYRARQRHSRRIVALKRILSFHADSRETLARFRREAEAAASLDHPNILPIYEVGEGEDGWPFFSMKYAAGGSLHEARESLGNTPRRCVALLAKVARAVQFAHRQGIFHRDLKPGNILLDACGEPLVSDFGLAKWIDTSSDLTRTLTLYGTPGYIAPEQAKGRQDLLGPAADVYSLGAILFHLLAGRPPFLGQHALAVIHQAEEEAAPKLRTIVPGMDRDLETICAKCLEHDPAGRYQSADDLAEDLERWLGGHAIVARPILPPLRAWRWSKRNPGLAASLALSCTLVIAFAVGYTHSSRSEGKPIAHLDKSIAVLPFENLSQEKSDAYIAEGIQGEILTRLAAMRDLKVISRSSTAQYRSQTSNLSQVARELGVTAILEGTVQRSGKMIRTTVQLIDVRSNIEVWGDSYDREFKNLFTVESEIAEEVADALKANVSSRELHALGKAPTKNPQAYDLFLRAQYEFHQAESSLAAVDYDRADAFYRQALQLDPNFVGAATGLAYSRIDRHWFVARLTTQELQEVRALIDRALTLAPDSPEPHFALATFYYWGQRRYAEALTEFYRTLQLQPNNGLARQFCAWVLRRNGDWERSITDAKKAAELDPRDSSIPSNLGITYALLRRWDEAKRAQRRALSIDPHSMVSALILAMTEVNATGDIPAARRAFEDIPAASSTSSPSVHGDVANLIGMRASLDVMERHFPSAFQTLATEASGADHGQSLIARVTLCVLAGQTAAAKAFAQQALPLLETRLKEIPDDTFTMTELAWVYLALQRHRDALRIAHRAADLVPVEKDAVSGPLFQAGLAQIQARAGAPDQAVATLRHLLAIPSGEWISVARLKIDPVWDPLRHRADFQELISGAEVTDPAR